MTAIATALPAGTYTSDPVHSTTGFAVKHMLATFRGSFAAFDAQLTVDEDGRAQLVGSVPVDTVVVKDENLVAHLQSPEFFDAEQYPQIRFESTDIAIEGGDVTVIGDLSLKGHTERVTATGHDRRPGRGPVRQHQGRPPARDRRRPHQVRPQLERAAAQGRLHAAPTT